MQPSSAPRGKLVVAHPERKAQRSLQRLVGATLCPVEVVDNLDALLELVDDQTIAIVDAGLASSRPNLRDKQARAWIAVPGEGSRGGVTSVPSTIKRGPSSEGTVVVPDGV